MWIDALSIIADVTQDFERFSLSYAQLDCFTTTDKVKSIVTRLQGLLPHFTALCHTIVSHVSSRTVQRLS